MELPYGDVGSLGLAIVLMLVAAKAHGRQIRVERERAGFHDVSFMTDDNPPWVEQLWARDRKGFWAIGLGAAVVLLAPTFSGSAPRRPFTSGPPR
ncbi:MAG: hypothetical protein LC624_05590, partial [Halobacteriales archaeon]|nr:hypothetical protein [Halobacteriales archaeon]